MYQQQMLENMSMSHLVVVVVFCAAPFEYYGMQFGFYCLRSLFLHNSKFAYKV